MSEHPGRLAGKTALITGIGSGQGRAVALLFAAEGATVLGADLNADTAQETASMIKSAAGQVIAGPAVDFADEATVAAWIDDAANPLGGLDILYLNAGACRFSPLEQTSAEDWHFTLRNELDVVFFPCRHAWRHLRARGGGSIITVGSTAGVTGSMDNQRVAHTASKGGVVAMTRQLAAEDAPLGIRAN
jgi:NAD(P)-dependent dehydrogenase (short-subunit alcohol dehydrogenase family)